MNLNKFVNCFKDLKTSEIGIKYFSDKCETDLLVFEEDSKGLSVSEFYASCVRKYFSEVLNYPVKEAEIDYMALIEDSSPSLILHSKVESTIKKWLVYIDGNVNIDKKLKLFKFNDDDCYISMVSEDDFFVCLIISTGKYFLLMASC